MHKRAQLLSLSPIAKGLVHMTLFAFATAIYLALLFGVGESNLPTLLRVETDWFLFEEMSAYAIAVFCVSTTLAAAGLGFCYGVVSALLYNAAARLVGGEVGRFRNLD